MSNAENRSTTLTTSKTPKWRRVLAGIASGALAIGGLSLTPLVTEVAEAAEQSGTIYNSGGWHSAQNLNVSLRSSNSSKGDLVKLPLDKWTLYGSTNKLHGNEIWYHASGKNAVPTQNATKIGNVYNAEDLFGHESVSTIAVDANPYGTRTTGYLYMWPWNSYNDISKDDAYDSKHGNLGYTRTQWANLPKNYAPIIRIAAGQSYAEVLMIPRPDAFSGRPSSTFQYWSGGEVIQRTGEIFFGGGECTTINNGYNMMILDPATGNYWFSNKILPNTASDNIFGSHATTCSGSGYVASDFALDANGNAYLTVRSSDAVWLVRVVPSKTGGDWKYNLVTKLTAAPGQGTRVGNYVGGNSLHYNYGSAFYNGMLYVTAWYHDVDTALLEVNPMSSQVYNVPKGANSAGIKKRVLDLASGQTAIVLEGVLYNDVNGNGNVADDGYIPLVNQTVAIYYLDPITKAWTYEGQRQTDGAGNYSFLVGGNGDYILRVVRPQVGGVNGVQTWGRSYIGQLPGAQNTATIFCTNGNIPYVSVAGTLGAVCDGALAAPVPDRALPTAANASGTDTSTQPAEMPIRADVHIETDQEVVKVDFGLTFAGSGGDASTGPSIVATAPIHVNNANPPVWLGATLGRYTPPTAGDDSAHNGTDDGVYIDSYAGKISLTGTILAATKSYTIAADVSGPQANTASLHGWLQQSGTSVWNPIAKWNPTISGGKATGTLQLATTAIGAAPVQLDFRTQISTVDITSPTNEGSKPYQEGTSNWTTPGEVEDYQISGADTVYRPAAKTNSGKGNFTVDAQSLAADATAFTIGAAKAAGAGVAKSITATVPDVSWTVASATVKDVETGAVLYTPTLLTTGNNTAITWTPALGDDVIVEVLFTKNPDAGDSTLVLGRAGLRVSGAPTVGTTVTAMATVRDTDGKLMADQVVTFAKTSPEMTLSATTCTTDSTGTCSITITTDVAGTYAKELSATVLISGVPTHISGSPATVTFNPAAGVKDKSELAVTPLSPLTTDAGVNVYTATTTVYDGKGTANGGKGNLVDLETVTYSVTKSDGSPVDPTKTTLSADSCSTSDVVGPDFGKCSVTLTSTEVGGFLIYATLSGKDNVLNSPTRVDYVAGEVCIPGVPVAKVCDANPDRQTRIYVDPDNSPADGVSPDVVHVQAFDAGGNPVPSATFNLSTTDPALAIASTVLTTGLDGKNTTDTFSLVAGGHVLTATVSGITLPVTPVPGSPLTVTFKHGEPDKTQSTLTLAPTTTTAGSVIVATVTVKDSGGNLVTDGRDVTITVNGNATFGTNALASPKVTSYTCSTDATGTCSVQFTDSKAEDVTVTAKTVISGVAEHINGSPATATFTAGDPVDKDCASTATQCTNLSAFPTTLEVGVDSTVTALVTDYYGNGVSGVTVNFGVNGAGKLHDTTLTTGTDGKAITTVTDSVAEKVNVTSTFGIAKTAFVESPVEITFTAGALDPDQSFLTLDKITAQAGEPIVATVTAKDAYGNLLANIPVSFSIDKDGTFGAATAAQVATATCTTTALGTCTATFTDPTAELVSVHATVLVGVTPTDVNDSPASATFTARPGVAINSTFAVTPSLALLVNTYATGTVTVKDDWGNLVGGEVVTFYTSLHGVLSSTTCRTASTGIAKGTCSVTLTDATAERVAFGAQVGGFDVVGSPKQVQFKTGGPSLVKSTFSVAPAGSLVAPLIADGIQAYVGTLTLKDDDDNLIADFDTSKILFGASSSDVAITAVVNQGDGTYTVNYTTTVASSTHLANVFLTDPLGQVGLNELIPFVHGPVSLLSFSVAATVPGVPVVANGSDTYTATVTAKDAKGNAVHDVNPTDIDHDLSHAAIAATPVVHDGSGNYTTFLSSTHASDAHTVTAYHQSVQVGNVENIPFVADVVAPWNSLFAVDPTTLGVTETSTATVTLRDSRNNPVSGEVAAFTVTGSATLSANSCTTGSDGVCSVTLTDAKAETVTVTAKYGAVVIPSPTNVNFIVGVVSDKFSDITVSPSTQVAGAAVTVTVKVRDDGNNPIGGLSASQFAIRTTNDKSAPALVLNDFTPLGNGIYTFKTTSEKVATFTFNAVVDTVALSERPTATFTNAGVSASTSFFVMTVNDQLADGTAQDKAVAHANDMYGNVVPGASVRVIDETTGANAGILNPANQICTTGADGTCELSWTATKVGTYTGQGTIDLLSPRDGSGILNQIRFSSGKSSAARSDLVVTPTTLTVGETSTATVTVRDASGILVPGAVVSFYLEDTLTDLPDGTKAPRLSALYCETGSSGTCSVTLTSQIAGVTKVHATLPVGGIATDLGGDGVAGKASPQTVTFTPETVCYPSPTETCSKTPELRTRVEVTTNGQEANGIAEDVATAYAFDKYGNPVPGTAVQTTTIDPSLSLLTPSAWIGADGSVALRYSSTVAGNHIANALIGGVTPQGSPLTLTFGSGTVASAVLTVSPLGPIQVDATYTLGVYATDALGNEVLGAVVAFGVPTDLTITGAGVPSCTTGPTGWCSITLTTTKAGAYRVSAVVPGVTVTNSPATLVFEAGEVCTEADGCVPDAGAPKTEVVLTVTGQLADGASPDVAVVHAYDKHGNPVQGAPVTSTAWDPTKLTVLRPIAPTGPDGSTTIQYTSLVAGEHVADVRVDGKTPIGSPVNPAFAAGKGDPTESSWTITPAGPLTVGTGVDATYTATTTVRDSAKNPVSGAIVTIVSAQPGVTFPSGSTCTTNASGLCQVSFYSTKSGTFEFTALLGADQIQTALSRAWEPDVVCAEASGCLPVDPSTPSEKRTRVEVTTNGVVADGAQRDVVTVYAFDQWGNGVPGALVKSTTADANLTIQTGIDGTNDLGVSTIWYSSFQAGNHDALVTVDGKIPANGKDATGSVTLNFVPGSVSATDSALVVAPDVLPAGDDATATATIRDRYLNPIPGVVVTFGTTGSAVLSDTTCTTGALGTCTVTVTDKVTESVQVSATTLVAGLATPISGSPATVLFINACIPGKDPGCTYDPDVPDDKRTRVEVTTDFQYVGTGTNIATVHYFDKYGNPVANGVVATSHAAVTALRSYAPRAGILGGQTHIDYTSTTSGAFQADVTIEGIPVVFVPQPGGPNDNPASIAAKSSPVTLNFVGVSAPAAPIILHPSNGDLTNNRPLVVDGTAEPGSEVTVDDRTIGGTICTTTVNAAGDWTCLVDLSDGDHTLVAHAVDSSGNRSPDSAMVTVKVDTVAPGAPTVDTANATEVAGNPGSSESGATIEVTWPDGSASTAVVSLDGSWTIPTPKDMDSGEISVTATDPAGNRSPETKIDLDTKAPGAPTVDTANATEVGGNPGSSEPGATIEVTWPDGTTDTTTVKPDGSWSIPTPPGTPSGTIEVTATDPAGNVSVPTIKNIDTEAPQSPVVDPTNGLYVTGKTEPGATITITDVNGNAITCTEGVIVADALGAFRCTPDTPLVADDIIYVTATDDAGNNSRPTLVIVGKLCIWVEFPVRAPEQNQVVVGHGFVPGETITLEFFSDPQMVGSGVADSTGAVVITFMVPKGTPGGVHTVRLTGEQSSPHMGYAETTFVVEVRVETGGSVLTSGGNSGSAAALLLLGLGVAVAGITFRRNKVEA